MDKVNKGGLSISRMTLGTVQLGLPYGIANQSGQPDEKNSTAILDAAIAGGVNCFDTASGYGESEQVLGRHFQGSDDALIVTKFEAAIDLNKTAADIERYVINSVEQSLESLQLKQIPILLLHTPKELLVQGEAIAAVSGKLVKDGLIGKAGVSLGAETGDAFDELWNYVQDDVYEAIQIPLNILDRRLINTNKMQTIGDANKIVFCRSVFLQGLFFMDPEQLPEDLQIGEPFLKALREFAEIEGMSVAELAMAYIRDLPQIDSMVIGAETPEQVKANIDLVNCKSISEKTNAAIAERFHDVPEHLLTPSGWARRMAKQRKA